MILVLCFYNDHLILMTTSHTLSSRRFSLDDEQAVEREVCCVMMIMHFVLLCLFIMIYKLGSYVTLRFNVTV